MQLNIPLDNSNFIVNKNDSFDSLYSSYDKLFNTNVDNTYKYLVNFSQTKDLPIHRWFYYQEGYSGFLVKQIIKRIKLSYNNPVIFDPFAGSGSTLLSAKELGFISFGFEINPFSSFMIEGKIHNYSISELDYLKSFKIPHLKSDFKSNSNYEFSMIDRIFEDDQFIKIEFLKSIINNVKVLNLHRILKIALLCILQDASYYKKAGNGLKKKRIYKKYDVFELYNQKLNQIIYDLENQFHNVEPKIYNDSCLNLNNYDMPDFDLSIFSPPYANCFDYYEVYKMELWLGDFVKSYDELRKLRKEALTSNLNANLLKKFTLNYESTILNSVLNYLASKNLWDKKIPKMLSLYFSEMSSVMELLYNKSKKDGYCVIVVGNSAYGGLAVPTDLILSEIASKIGFNVLEIIVARANETSSQQYKYIGKLIKYIRESIIILKK